MKLTKKARIDQVRALIDRNHYGVPFNDADLKLFSALTECELRYACREIDPNYSTNDRHVVVLAYDWVEPQGWSWRKAIEIGQHNIGRHAQTRISQAMRTAVNEQITSFLAMHQRKECEACSSTKSLAVDHVWPPFSHIMNGYIEQFGEPETIEDRGSGFKFSSKLEEHQWQNYHQTTAKLAILCRSCNSKKGTKPQSWS
jgi:5-methylcytosine-specific restriction endonuclease McrA